MRNLRLSGIFVATLFVFAALPALGQSGIRQREQRVFSAIDEGVKHPIAVPAEVLALLGKDERVRHVLEDENIQSAKLPDSWFSAAQIQLGNEREKDLIVMGEGPLRGGKYYPLLGNSSRWPRFPHRPEHPHA